MENLKEIIMRLKERENMKRYLVKFYVGEHQYNVFQSSQPYWTDGEWEYADSGFQAVSKVYSRGLMPKNASKARVLLNGYVDAIEYEADIDISGYNDTMMTYNIPQQVSLNIGDVIKHESYTVDLVITEIHKEVKAGVPERIVKYVAVPYQADIQFEAHLYTNLGDLTSVHNCSLINSINYAFVGKVDISVKYGYTVDVNTPTITGQLSFKDEIPDWAIVNFNIVDSIVKETKSYKFGEIQTSY